MTEHAGRNGSAVPIRFGTSGWRGVLGDEFTFARLRAVVAAAGDRIAASAPGARVLVAHDRRFLGEQLAQSVVRVLAARGLRPALARAPTPTPVLARAVRRSRAAAGLILTASHNPPEYHGLKLFSADGAGWSEIETRAVERSAARWLRAGGPPERDFRTRSIDLVEPYLDALVGLLDRAALRKSRLCAFYDALHGTGAGVVDEALRRGGLRVVVLRADRDPTFGGGAPDPLPARLRRLRAAVRGRRGLAIGLASDGDADRFAAVDTGGRCISESDAVALLVDHLARTGRVRRGVAVSCATGGLVARVAQDHGLRVRICPLGFKHLSAALLSGEADVAGEESGGFAWAPFARDKDGILAACFLAELVATSGASLGQRLRTLERRLGASACGRTAIAASPGAVQALARLSAAPPERVGRSRVREVLCRDGVRLALDDGFVMLRASGTEPVVRIYADAPTPSALQRRLNDGLLLLRRAGER